MPLAREPRIASAAFACVVAALLSLAVPAALRRDPGERAPTAVPAALASTDVSAKFDDGFYDKIQGWIAGAGAGGAAGASGTPPERNVMIAVGRTSADGRDPDTVAAENKDTVVRVLGEIGATDVVRAESLSFVTATVPLTRLAELAAYGSVYRIGDGEELLHQSVGTAKSTVDAEAADLRLPGGTTLSGAGVNVAILDSGIASSALDPASKLATKRQYCKDLTGCRAPAVGPRYAPASGSGAAAGASGAAANAEPELEVLVGGEAAPPLIEVAVSAAPATISLRATDAEGDAVTFSLWAAGGAAPISLADHGDGTATLTVTASSPGERPFEVAASDAHGEEWAPHILRIVPAAPAPTGG
ncbi:MAG: hypothetical protein OXU53_00660 [Deltaproteobacteria bacterium]|nr:hypothetical protein [Deltaproteobacteria bacterium]